MRVYRNVAVALHSLQALQSIIWRAVTGAAERGIRRRAGQKTAIAWI